MHNEFRHCEERSDEAISDDVVGDCFANARNDRPIDEINASNGHRNDIALLRTLSLSPPHIRRGQSDD